jgi:hypothetical protein
MRHLITLAILLLPGAAMANREGPIFNSATELRDWCREESEAAFIAKGVTPYNWAASYSDQGNVFLVKGKWHINSSFVTVECSVQKGAGPRSASMSIQDAPADADDGS